ncbi:FAD-dependent thymidylate synthase [Candidatus Woesearchaeota archaeon]|jgi:thymidylate synthase (FAD)|nr:FAD-dependent thymidylate synthase [Candidatus Woesearchaeota archaeon]
MVEEYKTGRIVVPAAEEVLGKRFDCLDHGFVRLVDYMGGDEAIVQAARVSYGKGTKSTSEDRGLIRYLMKHKHTTPFEMVEMKWHCKMPIFVARQWIRHRTANVNEYSMRYSESKNEFYVPELENVRYQSGMNKQGGSDKEMPETVSETVSKIIKRTNEQTTKDYNLMNKVGIARELSRVVLPTSAYTEWYWKNDLHNTLHFLRLRMDKHAQYEIRVFADAMADVVKKVAPMAYEAFEDYVVNSVNFSPEEQTALSRILKGEDRDSVLEGIKNSRERKEFDVKLEDFLN